MKRFIYQALIIFVFFIYIYDISFRAFPIGGRSLLSIFGLVLSLKYIVSPHYKLKKEYRIILLLFFVCVFWDILTSIINSQTQFNIIHLSLFQIIYIFGAYFVFICHNNKLESPNSYIETIAITVFLESMICVLIKFNDPLYNFFDSILVPHSELTEDIAIEDYYRFVGIGNATYFSVLPSCIIGSVCSVALTSNTIRTKKLFFYLSMFTVISIVSFLVARTSAVVALISLLLLAYNMGLSMRRIIKFIFFFFVLVVFIYYFITKYVDESIISWAFGVFMGDSLDSGSVGVVLSWWKNMDFDFTTFLVGDALYTTPDGHYYKKVDIGYFREIFYGGIVWVFLNLLLHYKILKFAYLNNADRVRKYMYMAMFVCYMLILAKGDKSMVPLFMIFLMFESKGFFEKNINKDLSINKTNNNEC